MSAIVYLPPLEKIMELRKEIADDEVFLSRVLRRGEAWIGDPAAVSWMQREIARMRESRNDK